MNRLAWGATGRSSRGGPQGRRPAAEAQARVASGENGDNGEDKKEESSSDDEEPEARRRLERRGRGLGRADAAQRWRDLEAKADQLCQRAQGHQPKQEKEPAKEKEPRSKKRRKKAQESSDDDDDIVPVPKNDQRPTLAECVAILREAEDLPDCPPSIGGVGEDPVSLLKERLDEVWRHVARCRLLAAAS